MYARHPHPYKAGWQTNLFRFFCLFITIQRSIESAPMLYVVLTPSFLFFFLFRFVMLLDPSSVACILYYIYKIWLKAVLYACWALQPLRHNIDREVRTPRCFLRHTHTNVCLVSSMTVANNSCFFVPPNHLDHTNLRHKGKQSPWQFREKFSFLGERPFHLYLLCTYLGIVCLRISRSRLCHDQTKY